LDETVNHQWSTYFALQTRRQESQDAPKFAQLSEEEQRLVIRNELAEHNKHLAAVAKQAGVITPIDCAVFQEHGYTGQYGGLGAKDFHTQIGLKKSQMILDHMGTTAVLCLLAHQQAQSPHDRHHP
jgi:DNA-damage-inducible protein D